MIRTLIAVTAALSLSATPALAASGDPQSVLSAAQAQTRASTDSVGNDQIGGEGVGIGLAIAIGVAAVVAGVVATDEEDEPDSP
ncbi:hypothetical protein [Sphingosinithalassobacter sp. LHW66-3]|uniref:hypothetical protein n=1 Tax=Sphingosinithalassobacter sp. LHW66-3 TaxID=3424718 RepID=UPI003D6B78C6